MKLPNPFAKKQQEGIGALSVGPQLCSALILLDQVFGDLNLDPVIDEVFRILHGRIKVEQAALPTILRKLFEEWSRKEDRPGTFEVSADQIVYSTRRGKNRQSLKDREFQVVIKRSRNQGTLMVIWQFKSNEAGRNSLAMHTSDGMTWTSDMEVVSEKAQENSMALAEAGAEIIGRLVQEGILKEGSVLHKASTERMAMLQSFRTSVREKPENL